VAFPAEFEMLADYLFRFAQQMLDTAGEFYPTAAFINREGKLEASSVYLGEHPPREELFAAHVQAFQRDAVARGYRATGILADGRAARPRGGEKTDAILVFLEHQSGEAISVVMQYRKGSNGQFEYAETFALKKQLEVFKLGTT
jgi:hypothetical protein